MPVAAHTRITLTGVWGTASAPIETWSFNVSCAPMSATTAAADKTAAASIATAWATAFSPLYGTDVFLTRVRVANLNAGGLVATDVDGSYHQGDWTGTGNGGGSTTTNPRMPLQVACCVSLTTARPGATGKGRFFIPAPRTWVLGTDYRWASGDVSALANTAKSFLASVASATGSAVVVSSSKGYLSPITGIRVGRVPDTQRSRRGDLIEDYQAVTVP